MPAEAARSLAAVQVAAVGKEAASKAAAGTALARLQGYIEYPDSYTRIILTVTDSVKVRTHKCERHRKIGAAQPSAKGCHTQ